ncbi:GNAT family N-acetyltransferase [Streptomyces sp. NPDC047315]|uniref:GNAT family N-acetyltransferase n=1 Tax=Streptomyces sp. NPDC047315 TaxID=3155142 RepID=UPI0033D777F0
MKHTYALHDGRASVDLVIGLEGPAIVSRVIVRPSARGQGWGCEVLRAVLDDADREGVPLILEVDDGSAEFSGAALTDWYSRYGFEPVPGSDQTMIRHPRKSIDPV